MMRIHCMCINNYVLCILCTMSVLLNHLILRERKEGGREGGGEGGEGGRRLGREREREGGKEEENCQANE